MPLRGGEVQRGLNEQGVDILECPVSPERLTGLLKRIDDNTISNKIAKQVFDLMWQGDKDADQIIEEQGLKQVTDTGAIEKMVDEVIAANQPQVEQFRAGQEKVLGFFVGQVMKASRGKANPQAVNELRRAKLKG